MAILSLADDINCKTFASLSHEKNILSPIFAPVIFIISFNASVEKNFPTGPLASISLFFSKVKYARPDAPSDFAHLSKLSKKLVRSNISNGFLKSGLSVAYFNIVSSYGILGNFSNRSFLSENFLKIFIIRFSTTLKTSSCSTKDISRSSW